MTTSLTSLGFEQIGVNLCEFEFVWPLRVYHEDIDTQGIVYYANYLKFMERTRTEWLRAMGVEQSILLATHGVAFVVADISIKYHRPARFNDELSVGVRMSRLRAASMKLSQPVWREPQELICHAEVTVACLDTATNRPRAFPTTVLAELEKA